MSKWLDRIQALLAKAESTEFPDEAESLISKAQSLMRQHAIDEAMLGADRAEDVVSETFIIEGSYLKAKVQILHSVASNNNVKLVLEHKHKGAKYQSVYMIGFQSDITNVQAMYTSMVIYSSREMLKAPQVGHGKSFRNSFLLAFASTLNRRLRESNEVVDEQVVSSGGSALVLVDRSNVVNDKMRELFPRLRSSSGSRATSSAGYSAGREAGNRVSLNSGVSAGSSRALTS